MEGIWYVAITAAVVVNAASVITVTSYPPYNTTSMPLVGYVTPASADVVIAAYGYTNTWWSKGSMQPDAVTGQFSINVNTNPDTDRTASLLGLVLISKSTAVPVCNSDAGINCATLPKAGVLASWEMIRPGSDVVNFSSVAWEMKDSAKTLQGPGPNYFASNNVVVADNSLTLKLTRDTTTGDWSCSEVQSIDSYGYGTYVFWVRGPLNQFDELVTLGLFTWDDFTTSPYREIDFEVARWGWADDPTNMQFVVQPYATSGNLQRATIGSSQDQTFVLRWTAGALKFAVFPTLLDCVTDVVGFQSNWTYKGAGVPTPGMEKIHLNLWLSGGTHKPGNASGSITGSMIEVQIAGFAFTNDDSSELCLKSVGAVVGSPPSSQGAILISVNKLLMVFATISVMVVVVI